MSRFTEIDEANKYIGTLLDIIVTQIELNIMQDPTGGWYCSDSNYDYADDTGGSPMGNGSTIKEAIGDYFEAVGFEKKAKYVIDAEDLKNLIDGK